MSERLARLVLPLALLATACATTVPLQTASAVPSGTVRLSDQVTSSPWCTFTSDPDNCAYTPGNGGLGIPELRLNGRVGVRDRVDLGISLFTTVVLGSGVRWGGLFDGKVEVWRAEIEPGRKQLVSAGAGLGLTRMQDLHSTTTDDSYLQMDVVVPVLYGYQLEAVELVAGPHFIERVSIDPPGNHGAVGIPWAGLTLGFVTRGHKAKFGLAVSYEAPLRYFSDGAFNISVGLLYDVGGKDRDARVSPPQIPAAVQTGQGT